mmetsp:Transcript_105591/g.303706  ORF Transcript_105591/g.303706 Transcript_105591/m.303706 type:complete len:261 (+) Transcript_105591:696-1478(+)
MVVCTRVDVPLGHLRLRILQQALHRPLALELTSNVVLHTSPEQHDGRKALNLLLAANLLEFYAIYLQHPDIRFNAVSVEDLVLAIVDLLLELVPSRSELSAMRTPIGVEVHESEIVSVDDLVEIVMLKLVTGGAPVRVQLGHLLLREALFGILQLHELLLCVWPPSPMPLLVHPLLSHILGDVLPLGAERVPDANCNVVATYVHHGDVEVYSEHGILVGVDDDVRSRLRAQKGRQLAHKEHRACDDCNECQSRAGCGRLG